MKLFLIIGIVLSCLTTIHAEELQRNEWRLMLGVDAGLGVLSTAVGGEAHKTGFTMTPKVLVAREFDGYTFDLGMGISFQDLTAAPNNVFAENNLKMTSLLLELGIRGEIISKIFFGPVVNLQLGQDVSLRELANPTAIVTTAQSTLWMLGLQAMYDLSSANTRCFLGVKVASSLSIPDRQYTTVQGVLQVGLPLNSSFNVIFQGNGHLK